MRRLKLINNSTDTYVRNNNCCLNYGTFVQFNQVFSVTFSSFSSWAFHYYIDFLTTRSLCTYCTNVEVHVACHYLTLLGKRPLKVVNKYIYEMLSAFY